MSIKIFIKYQKKFIKWVDNISEIVYNINCKDEATEIDYRRTRQ